MKVAGLGNPKELMMAMLEQLDSFQDIVSVVKILPSLRTVLTRLFEFIPVFIKFFLVKRMFSSD